MTKPMFNATIIDELKQRVAAHNEIVPTEQQMKLGQAKKLYKRWHSGPDPHAHALAMLDGRLLSMQTATLTGLAKAQEPFDPGEHPRGRGGRFRGGGGGPPARQDDYDDRLLEAAQTQVIPETRYSVFGPPIMTAAGIGYGALGGATGKPGLPWKGGGTVVDRATTHLAGKAGQGAGKIAGVTAGQLAIGVPRSVARVVIPVINRTTGSRIPRPRPDAGDATMLRMKELGGRGGRAAGRGAGHAYALASYPAARLKQILTRSHGRVAGGIAGAAAGALFPGIMIGASLRHLQERVGPYEDAAFPRRVKKLAGDWWNAPEVLAKQEELLAQPELAKAIPASVLRYAARGRQAAAALGRRFRRTPAAAQRAPRPPSGSRYEAAKETFEAHAPKFRVGRHLASRAQYVGRHVAGGGIAGAATGGLIGAARAEFALKHPRDPRTGKFSTRGEAVKAGLKHGALAGAGIGLAAGLVAANRGHAKLIERGLRRLRGEEAAEVKDASGKVTGTINVPETMKAEAEKASQQAYAKAYYEKHAKKGGALRDMKAEPPGSTEPLHESIIKHLGTRAVAVWRQREGDAMRAGPQQWYGKQIDNAFDSWLKREVGKLPVGDRTLPLIPHLKDRHLIEAVDQSKLTPEQKKVWDSAVATRQSGMDEIGAVYAEREQRLSTATKAITDLDKEKGKLERASERLETEWKKLAEQEPSNEDLRAFAQLHLKEKPPAKLTGQGLVDHIQDRLVSKGAEQDARLDQIDKDLLAQKNEKRVAESLQREDLDVSEAQRVRNPFVKNEFFKPRDIAVDTPEGWKDLQTREYKNASKAFRDELQKHTEGTLKHLENLVGAEDEALKARLPKHKWMEKLTQHKPLLAARLQQGMHDYAELTGAHRASLTGQLRKIYDFLNVNKNPAEAWKTAKHWSKAAADFWNSSPGKWLRQNWKLVVAVIGPLTTIGAIDIQAGKGKKIIEINPRKWHRPKDLDLVAKWPNPAKRPDEFVFGVSYRDKSNQQKFLTGIHVKSKDGAQYQSIPYGAEVDQWMSVARGGDGGSNNKAQKVDVQNQNEVDKAVRDGLASGHIKSVGPSGFEFKQREQNASGGAEENHARQGYFDKHVKFLMSFKGQSTDKHDRYFQSLHDLFDNDRMGLLTQGTRAGLLFGTKSTRGLFANRNGVYQNSTSDPGAIEKELRWQIMSGGHSNNHKPQTPEEYTQLRRAIWVAEQHFHLPQRHVESLINQLDKVYGKAPPQSAGQASGGLRNTTLDPSRNVHDHINEIIVQIPPADRVNPVWVHDTDQFRRDLLDAYHRGRTDELQRHPGDDDAAHKAGLIYLENELVSRMGKAEQQAESYKLFGLEKRHTIPSSPGVAPAHQPPFAPQYPKPPPQAPAGGLHPAHFLGSVGQYGLSQAGWDVLGNVSQHLTPGGGMMARAARFGMQSLGGVGGSFVGEHGGQAVGRALGDRSGAPPEPAPAEGLARMAGGLAGQSFLGPAAGRTISGAATRVLGGAVGGRFGSIIKPIGAILGAGLSGALSEEGAGILYHHLSRYGEHVPAHALKHFERKRGQVAAR